MHKSLSTVNNNAEWKRIRLHLAKFPLRFHPEKNIEILDTCRASKKLRQLFPYISLGRLGLWRYDPNECGQADDFVCLYFHDNQYVVLSYDNNEKQYFNTSKTAIDFVEQNLDKENPFAKST